jgi:hypothetical protein
MPRDRRDVQHERTDGGSGTGPGRVAGRCSVVVVAVNAEQAEDWNGASGREFIEQRERHEQMLGRLRARLLAAAQIQDGENILDIGCGCGDTTIPAELTRQVRDRLMAYASPDGVTMPGAAWLVTAQAV